MKAFDSQDADRYVAVQMRTLKLVTAMMGTVKNEK